MPRLFVIEVIIFIVVAMVLGCFPISGSEPSFDMPRLQSAFYSQLFDTSASDSFVLSHDGLLRIQRRVHAKCISPKSNLMKRARKDTTYLALVFEDTIPGETDCDDPGEVLLGGTIFSLSPGKYRFSVAQMGDLNSCLPGSLDTTDVWCGLLGLGSNTIVFDTGFTFKP